MIFNIPNEKFFLILAMLWSLPWKGVALWKAANRKHKWWFIAFLLVNTLAILEIAYIFYFSGKTDEKAKEPGKPKMPYSSS